MKVIEINIYKFHRWMKILLAVLIILNAVVGGYNAWNSEWKAAAVHFITLILTFTFLGITTVASKVIDK